MATIERKLVELQSLNPEGARYGITRSVADDVKWAGKTLELLRAYIRDCPARPYWIQVAKNDARIAEFLDL
jgi:hypothetical protein